MFDRIPPVWAVRREHQLSQTGHIRGKIALRVKNRNGTIERKQP